MAGGAAALMLGSTAYASVLDRPFFKVLGVVVVWGADGVNGNGQIAHDFVLLNSAQDTAGNDLIGDTGVADGATVVTGTLTPIDANGDNEVAGGTVTNPITGATSGGGFDPENGNGILDAGDSLTAFGVDANTDVGAGMINTHRSSFYVASNTAFDIYAESTLANATGDFDTVLDESNITFAMSVNDGGATGITEPGTTLTWGARAQDPSVGSLTPFPAVTSLADLTTAPVKVFDGGRRTASAPGNLAAQSVRFDNVYTLDDGTGAGYDLSQGVGTITADVTFTVYTP